MDSKHRLRQGGSEANLQVEPPALVSTIARHLSRVVHQDSIGRLAADE